MHTFNAYTHSWEIILMRPKKKNEIAQYTINQLAKVIITMFRARGSSHWKYMNFVLPCGIYGSLYMLYQCIPFWRNIIDTSTTFCDELLPTNVDNFYGWNPVIKKTCKPLNDSHTILVWVEAVTLFWIYCKYWCYFIKHLPCSPCCQLVFSTKSRNSVTTSKCIPEGQFTTYFS